MNQDDVELVHVDQLMCPTEREAKFDLFPTICNSNQDCYKLGGHFRCCKLFGGKRCHLGVEKPLEDIQHERKLFKGFRVQLNKFQFQHFLVFHENVPTIHSLKVSGTFNHVFLIKIVVFRESVVRVDENGIV